MSTLLYNLEFDNDVFKSAEHLYQSRKAIYHERHDLDDDIRSAPDVKTSKSISKEIKIEKIWEDIKPIVMGEILKIKFQQCTEFRDFINVIWLPCTQCTRFCLGNRY